MCLPSSLVGIRPTSSRAPWPEESMSYQSKVHHKIILLVHGPYEHASIRRQRAVLTLLNVSLWPTMACTSITSKARSPSPRAMAQPVCQHSLVNESVPANTAGLIANKTTTRASYLKCLCSLPHSVGCYRTEATPEAAMAARLAAPSTVYGGGAKSGKNRPKETMSKQEKNSLKRGGAGRHAFKSKTRHKRRH